VTPASPAIVWFRNDLRVGDNPALVAAIESGRPIACLYVFDEVTPGRWRMGGASRWWLHHSLLRLAASLERLGAPLILRRGIAHDVVPRLVSEFDAAAVYWNRQYEAFAVAQDTRIKMRLGAMGVEAHSFNGSLLHEPWTVKTKTGEPYRVFTPFWRACAQLGLARSPLPSPKRIAPFAHAGGENLTQWRLLPTKPNWAVGFEPEWTPGEAGAHAALIRFLEGPAATYANDRDQLGIHGTSRLSPHLHFGEISPVQIWAAAHNAPRAEKFLSEVGWREFAHHLLFHWPNLPERNWRGSFDAFPWRTDASGLAAWQRGQTGYPVVDAAMRELWTTGYMHNRARMIAASFLIKHLLIDWRAGEDWFWDTLLDADLANNAASWQWIAGCGADAAPYFRIFNPVTQGERYDANGVYVRRWIPEIAALPNNVLHQPWQADAETLSTAGVRLGQTYPYPIVEHGVARQRALAAFSSLRSEI